MPELQCVVVTPEATLLDEQAEFVALPLFDGEIGIASGHSPMIGRLGCGEMRVKHGAGTDHYYIEGGFVEVLGNVVSVLTNRGLLAEELDRTAVEEQLTTARSRQANTPELMSARDRAVTQARAQLRVAQREG